MYRRSRLKIRDAFGEAFISIARRPGRLILTALGTVLGVGTVIATFGIVDTANQEVSSQFDAVESTQVTVNDLRTGDIPLASERAVQHLHGVRQAGITWIVSQNATVSPTLEPSLESQFSQEMPIIASTPDGLSAMGASIVSGRLFDSGDESRRDAVALLGSIGAQSLGISSVSNQPAVFVNGVPLAVIGIVSGLGREPQGLPGLILPATTAEEMFSGNSNSSVQGTMLVSTDQGAASVVSSEIAAAIDPERVGSLQVVSPPNPATLRRQVEGTTSSLLVLLAGLSLIIGTIAIMNTTLLSVLQRIPEIGLRRALGARPRHITEVTLIEATLIGGFGGVVGAALGVLVTSAVAISKNWTAVLSPQIVVLAPLIGFAAGLLAGLYPAWRATHVEPIVALQR